VYESNTVSFNKLALSASNLSYISAKTPLIYKFLYARTNVGKNKQIDSVILDPKTVISDELIR
jgi:hypothetical protein